RRNESFGLLSSRIGRCPANAVWSERARSWAPGVMPSEDQPVINCRIRSPANPELLDDRPVPLGVLLAQVLDQTPPLAAQHQQTASRMVVLGDLQAEGVDTGELPLLANPADEGQTYRQVVQAACEIEEMGLDHQLALTKGRTNSDVDDRPVTDPLGLDPTGVDAGGDQQWTVVTNVRRGKPQGP